MQRYSYEFKLKSIADYRSGLDLKTPDGISECSFRRTVQEWSEIEKFCGPEMLRPKLSNTHWSLEDKLDLVFQVIEGMPIRHVSTRAGIDHSMLRRWVNRFKMYGSEGLSSKISKSSSKRLSMKKLNYNNPKKRVESEHEELVRLRAENEYIKAEIEIIKKEIALREEREAARLKAKKQQSSKNSASKDTN